MSKEKYAYLIKCPNTGYIRIGKANSARQKIAEQRVIYGINFIPLAYFVSPPIGNPKNEIQRKFEKYRVDYPEQPYPWATLPGFTDWFDVPLQELIDGLKDFSVSVQIFTEAERIDIDLRTKHRLLDDELESLISVLRSEFYGKHDNYQLNRPNPYD